MTDNPVKSFDADMMRGDAELANMPGPATVTANGFVQEMDASSAFPDTEPTDSEKLDYLYQTAVRVQNLIDQVTPEDIGKIQKTVSNPLVRKMLGL